MNIREIEAKQILTLVKRPDFWFGAKFNMNLYRGCEHRCIYCDSRSECYQIADFDGELLVKINAVELLKAELSGKRVKGTVGTGAMGDPYTLAEKKYNLTGATLRLIAGYGFGIHINTKSDLILRDLPVLRELSKVRATVAFTLTTTDPALAACVEPYAPTPAARLKAMKTLADAGVIPGVLLMPVLPYLEDKPENIRRIVQDAVDHGARFIFPSFGMSLRDRQRDYYYRELDRLFPGIRPNYERTFGGNYHCPSPRALELEAVFREETKKHRLPTSMEEIIASFPGTQLSLFS